MPDLTLYGTRLSPFVEKVAKALELKGLPFAIQDVKSPGDLKRWNPVTRKMPVLEIEGERIWDSSRILRRLDQVAPEPRLVADDPKVAAWQRLLEDWADESFYWYVMALRWNPTHTAATLAQITAALPAPARPLARFIIRRQIGRAPDFQGLGRLPQDVLLEELGYRLDELVALLGDGPCFFADRVSVADLAVYGQLQTLGSGPTPDGWALVEKQPALLGLIERVRQAGRPT
jgi:glutathione S-transferase